MNKPKRKGMYGGENVELSEEGKKTIDELNKWNAELNKAATNICQCLDGFTIHESEYILDKVNSLLRRTVVHVSNIRGIDGKR